IGRTPTPSQPTVIGIQTMNLLGGRARLWPAASPPNRTAPRDVAENMVAVQQGAPRYTIAVDTGGTFTDVVLADEQRVLGLYKALTTRQHLFDGIYEALIAAAAAQDLDIRDLLACTGTFVYSTTNSTNAIITDTTARTAFITTRGNADVLLYRE